MRQDREMPTTDELLAGILDHLAENGGRLMISLDDQAKNRHWVVGYEFGHEDPTDPENDMVGGASYGLDPSLRDALTTVFDEVGAKVPE